MKYFLKCLYNYTNCKGRARRKEFWFFVLYASIILVLWTLIWLGGYFSVGHDRFMQFLEMNGGGGTVIVLLGYSSIYLLLGIPFFSVASRRFHDTGIKLEDYKNQSYNLSISWTVILLLIYMFCMAWFYDLAIVQASACCLSLALPFIITAIVYSRCLFIKGTEGDNEHGPDPRIDDPIENVHRINGIDIDNSEQDSSTKKGSDPFAPKR